MKQKIIQEFTEVPKMSKWNNIELTEKNVFDYVQELEANIHKYETTGYFKTYFDKYEDNELIEHQRIDSTEYDDIKLFLSTEVLHVPEEVGLLKSKQYNELVSDIERYNQQFDEKVIITPVDITNVKLTDIDETYVEVANVNDIAYDIIYELEQKQVVDAGYNQSYKYIQNTEVYQRLITNELNEEDVYLIEYLEQGNAQSIDIADLDEEQSRIYYNFRLVNDETIKSQYEQIFNIVFHGSDIDQMIEDLETIGITSEYTDELVSDGYEELTYNLIQERGRFIEDDVLINRQYENTGYFLNTIMLDDVPIIVDLQQSKIFPTIEKAMEHFDDLNRNILIDNFKEFYKDNSDEILYSNYEEAFISDLASKYYGLDIVKFRDQVLKEHSPLFKKEVEINKLVDDAYDKLKDITIFENAYFTATSDYDGNFDLEVDSANMLLTFDLDLNMSSQGLAYVIANEFIEQYEQTEEVLNSLENKCEQLSKEFKQLAFTNYNQLHQIGMDVSGRNGINFEDFEGYFKEYCSIEDNKINIEEHLNDVLQSFIEMYAEDDKQTSLNIIEIVNRFCNQTSVDINNFTDNLEQLSKLVITDAVKELVSPANENFNQEFEVDIRGFSDETKTLITSAIESEFNSYYQHLNIDTKDAYFISNVDNTIDFGIWDNYKFINDELKYCMENIDYFDNNLNYDELLSHIAMIETDLDIDYTHNSLRNTVNIPNVDEFKTEFSNRRPYSIDEISDQQIIDLEWKAYYQEQVSNLRIEFPYSDELIDYLSKNNLTYENINSDSQVQILLEKAVTEALRTVSSPIYAISREMEVLEKQITEQFNQVEVFEPIQNVHSPATQLELIIAKATMNLDQQCINFLNDIREDQYPMIKHMLDSNIDELLQSTLTYIELEDNKFNINEEYVQRFHRVEQAFEPYENIRENSVLKKHILSNPSIKHNMIVGMGLSSGEKQLLELANKSKGDSVSINDVCNLDKRNIRLADKIIDELSLIKDETLVSAKSTDVNIVKSPIGLAY